jgi:hypothetical protein
MLSTATKAARRLPVALAALGLVGVCVAPSASAAPPDPIELTYQFIEDPNGDLEFPLLCSFEVAITVEGKTKSIELPDGTFITTAPGQTATVTNLMTGETLDFRISGTNKTTLDGVVVFRGANLIIRSTAFGDDTNALLFAHGRYTFDTTATPKFAGVGTLTDVCAALA